MSMEIVFTEHAVFKLKLLKDHGFTITQETVRNTIQDPDFTTEAKYGRKAAHKNLYGGLMVRVIYDADVNILVVTVMVARRERYERDKIR
ncbi:MAG: hypothetical protein V3T58_07340 [Candidatus Hydrothermarchaeales archaeon]